LGKLDDRSLGGAGGVGGAGGAAAVGPVGGARGAGLAVGAGGARGGRGRAPGPCGREGKRGLRHHPRSTQLWPVLQPAGHGGVAGRAGVPRHVRCCPRVAPMCRHQLRQSAVRADVHARDERRAERIVLQHPGLPCAPRAPRPPLEQRAARGQSARPPCDGGGCGE
ncbi:unnamed protein product, partial [Prorocentrum cordatum]